MLLRWIAIAIIVLGSLNRADALTMELKLDPREGLISINLWNKIEDGDGAKFRNLITPYIRAGYLLFQVNTFSPGGRFYEAISIGNQIRQLNARTFAPVATSGSLQPDCWASEIADGSSPRHVKRGFSFFGSNSECVCASGCFLIWMSGLVRDGNYVGVHRHGYVSSSVPAGSLEQFRAAFATDRSVYIDFMRRADVPTSLIERIMATGSGALYYPNENEIAQLRSTPWLEEYVAHACGRRVALRPHYEQADMLPADPAADPCYRGILKTLMREGARNYLMESASDRRMAPAAARR